MQRETKQRNKVEENSILTENSLKHFEKRKLLAETQGNA